MAVIRTFLEPPSSFCVDNLIDSQKDQGNSQILVLNIPTARLALVGSDLHHYPGDSLLLFIVDATNTMLSMRDVPDIRSFLYSAVVFLRLVH